MIGSVSEAHLSARDGGVPWDSRVSVIARVSVSGPGTVSCAFGTL